MLGDVFATMLLFNDPEEAGLFAKECFELPLASFPTKSLQQVGRAFKNALYPDKTFKGVPTMDGVLDVPDAPFAEVRDPSRWTRDWNLAIDSVQKADSREDTLLAIHLQRMRDLFEEMTAAETSA